jgi:hypothetical protein
MGFCTTGEGYGGFITDDIEQLTGHPAISYKKFASDFEQMFRRGAI